MVMLVAVLGRPEGEPVLRADPVTVLFAVWPRCPRGGVTPAVGYMSRFGAGDATCTTGLGCHGRMGPAQSPVALDDLAME